MDSYAAAFVETAASYGYTLDYSIESLATVDELLDRFFAVRNPIGRRRGKLALDRFHQMVPIVGAYVGEALLRTYGRAFGGRWAINADFDEPGLRFGDQTWMFPLAKAEKRFRSGHSDSFAFFGEAMADMMRMPPPPYLP